VPTVVTLALSGLALGAPLASSSGRDRIWLAGALCAALPDVDVIGFRFGVHYGDLLGHRGLTHSLAFAVALSSLVVALTRARLHARAAPLWLYLFVATASHGCLDALTDGGFGVAFFSHCGLRCRCGAAG
jgi:inner membrane protein